MANAITKTGICDSCGGDKILTATPSAQPNNPKLWWYCDICKFAHDKEKRVQVLLRTLAQQNPAAADDPQVVSQLHEQVATQILTEKAQAETLAPNETLIDSDQIAPTYEQPAEEVPAVIEGETVPEAPAEITDPITGEALANQEAASEEQPTE